MTQKRPATMALGMDAKRAPNFPAMQHKVGITQGQQIEGNSDQPSHLVRPTVTKAAQQAQGGAGVAYDRCVAEGFRNTPAKTQVSGLHHHHASDTTHTAQRAHRLQR